MITATSTGWAPWHVGGPGLWVCIAGGPPRETDGPTDGQGGPAPTVFLVVTQRGYWSHREVWVAAETLAAHRRRGVGFAGG